MAHLGENMNNKEIVENLTKKICNNMDYNPETDKAGSVIVILALTGIVLSLIRIIQECNSSKLSQMTEEDQAQFLQDRIKSLCSKNTWISRWRLNRIVKQHLSTKDYKMIGKLAMDAIMEAGKSIECQECYALIGELKNV